MPTITRKLGEKVLLQTNEGMVEIEVASLTNQRVQLNITAPRSINIYRDERKEVRE